MLNDKYPFAPPLGPEDKAAPHRRRRHRGGRRPAGAGTPQNAPQNAPQKAPQDPAPAPAARGKAAGQQRPAAGAQPGGKKAQPAAPRREPRRPAQTQPQPQQPRRAPAPPEDPGLLLISRRPPQQKFANFEEYIAAHGGVTAPLPDAAPADPEPAE